MTEVLGSAKTDVMSGLLQQQPGSRLLVAAHGGRVGSWCQVGVEKRDQGQALLREEAS